MAAPTFVHLHTHSEFSLLDGACRLDRLVARAAELGMPALALTDHGTMHGAVDFYVACKEAGIKPIIGLEGYMAPDDHRSHEHRAKGANWHVTLLARNQAGYKNLLKLATIAAIEGHYKKPRIDRQLLEQYREGLIVLSGCMQGELSVALSRDDYETARAAAAHYAEILGRDAYFLEMQNHGIEGQDTINAGVRRLAAELGLRTVCTNDVHYLTEADSYAHEVLLCIGTTGRMSDPKRLRYRSNQLYLKSAEEMARAFPDDPDALATTLLIADMCDLELEFGRTDLPVPDVPEGLSAIDYLRQLAYEGLHRRVSHVTAVHEERLRHELDVIGSTGFAEYILIVRDFAAFARRRGIHFGVRGSAAGSLVSYCVDITDVDPVHYDLTFERFLNVERAEMPDIDMDFEDSRRQEVIEYVTDRYGQEHVAQIVTFGTLAAKAALKDAGRALEMPQGLVHRVVAAVPGGNTTLDAALQSSPELADLVKNNDQVKHLFETAKRFEGIARHSSVHAAGVVISRQPLVEHTPLKRNKGGYLTQYPASALAKIGLLKMDFLGLINLSILGRTLEYVRRTRGIEISMDDIPLDDRPTFELLGRGETIGVFQLESSGMRRHIRNLKPTSIKEVAAMVALYRPGPLNSIPDFIKAKHGLKEVKYLHPALEPALRETYGIIVYQDQVLTVAREIAGFSMGQADLLRRAISKKLEQQLKDLEAKFMAGAESRGIEPGLAKQIYELIEPFAGYGFNKAHAVCYALVAYQTAYLKVNYPAEYMAALLACYVEKPDKMAVGLAEAKRMGIRVLGPDVNASDCDFMPADGCIRFGLAAVKNVGHGVAEAIVAARNEGGPYTSLVDFCRRLAGGANITRATVETLVSAGAFDSIHPNRRALMSTVEHAVRAASALQRSDSEGMCLFDPDDLACGLEAVPPDVPDYPIEERLKQERELLGVYLSGHPLDRLPRLAVDASLNSAAELSDLADDERVCLVGLITDVRRRVTQKGATMAYLTLEDASGVVAVTVFPRVLASVDADIVEQQAVLVQGRVSVRDTGATADDRERSTEVIADSIMPIDTQADNGSDVPSVHIRLDTGHAHLLRLLRSTLERSPGALPVYLHVPDGRTTRKVMAGLSIDLSADTRAALEHLIGRQAVWVE